MSEITVVEQLRIALWEAERQRDVLRDECRMWREKWMETEIEIKPYLHFSDKEDIRTHIRAIMKATDATGALG